jgi:signal transduction histidine kinase
VSPTESPSSGYLPSRPTPDRRRTAQALRILADATAILSESIDYEVTLANVARSLVPRLGEACTIHVVDERGLALAAVAGAGPEKGDTLRKILARFPTGGDVVQTRVARTGVGEGFPQVTDDFLKAISRDAEDLGLRRALGVRSLLFVPLKVRQETLGVVTLSSSERTYDEHDRELVDEIACRAALAVEHARLHRDVESQRARLRVIADTSRALAPQLDIDGIATAISRVLGGGVLVGLTAGSNETLLVRGCAAADLAVKRRLCELVGCTVSLPSGSLGAEVLRCGEPQLLGPEATERLQPAFGRLAKEFGLGSALIAPLLVQGRAIGLMSVFRNSQAKPLGREELSLVGEIADRAAVAFERARLFESQQRATERLRLLADAGTLLAQSLQVDPTLASLARLTVGRFSHACAVDLVEDGLVTSVAVAAVNAELETALRRVLERYTVGCPPRVLREAFESGSPLLLRTVDVALLRELAVNEEHLEALTGLGLRSAIVIPLVARGSQVGVVSLARTNGTPYDDDDLALAEELGRRAALAVDNARLFKRATEAIAIRDEFLSIASHELNTPLTPLKMQLDSLRRGDFPWERTVEKLDRASRQVTRLAKLVNELLDVSRISGGRLRIEPERFDLALLVDEIVARVSEEAERAGSQLSVHSQQPCIGSWDRMRIDQVLTNLLTNAIKYGSGKPIDVRLSSGDSDVSLVVRDHGIGIAPEHQRRIFERFERAASTRHYGGFGLGLWIARQIVEASGGSISVDSAPDKGSTFVVKLPIS